MKHFVGTALAALLLSGCGLLAGFEAGEPSDDTIITGVNYVGLSTPDVAAAEAYYASSVATETVDTQTLIIDGPLETLLPDMKGAEVATRLIRSSNSQLRLMSFPEAPGVTLPGAVPVNGPGVAHVCFQVAKETNTYSRMVEAGATPVGVPNLVHLNEKNPVYYGYLRDPQGVITEIEEVDVAALELPAPPKNQYRIRHVSLATPNLEAMINFYSTLLGGQKPRHAGTRFPIGNEKTDMVSGLEGSKMEMAWFQIRNLELEIFQYHSHPTERPAEPRPLNAPGYNMIMLDVSDMDQARKRLLDAGADIVTDVSSLEDGQVLFARDPDGNLLGLHVLPENSVFSAKNFPNNGI